MLGHIFFHAATELILGPIPRHIRKKLALWCLFVGTNLCILAFVFEVGAEGGGSMWEGFGQVLIGFGGILLLFMGYVLWPDDLLSLPFDEPDAEQVPHNHRPPAVSEQQPDVSQN